MAESAFHDMPRAHPSELNVAEVADAVQRGQRYLRSQIDSSGIASSLVAFDENFTTTSVPGRVREILHRRFGVDIGFSPRDEAFTAMLAMVLTPPASHVDDIGRIAALRQQVLRARRDSRFAFFPDVPEFAADTDCTAVAARGLFAHGMIGMPALRAFAAELLKSVNPVEPETRDVFMVYWEDGVEEAAVPRGRKHDAVACANALDTVHLAFGHDAVAVQPNLRYLTEHLNGGRYRIGTRYYPAPEAFIHAVSRLCVRCPQCAAVLGDGVRRALSGNEMPNGPLPSALRLAAEENVGMMSGRGVASLVHQQRGDGSWPPHAYYRMGRFPVYFGSPQLTTLFAVSALSRYGRQAT